MKKGEIRAVKTGKSAIRVIGRIIAVLVISITIMSMPGCALVKEANTPPSISEIEEIFLENYDDFTLVTEYLLDYGREEVYIEDSGGTMHAGLERIDIADEAVADAVVRLWRIGCSSIAKDESDNSIAFELWWCSQDKACGVAFSINGEEPTVQFMTEREALQKDGWYYYVEDYHSWRIQRQSADDVLFDAASYYGSGIGKIGRPM